MNREQVGLRARPVQGTARLLKLNTLHAIRGQDRDLHALEFVCHVSTPPLR
jgi:hypothetical protein